MMACGNDNNTHGNTADNKAEDPKKEAMQENREVAETHVDNSAEVPGQGPPSGKRHHPQRQMYGKDE